MKTCSVLFILWSCALFAQKTAGLNYQKHGSLQGYILFAPLFSQTTYLIDKCGRLVHTWESKYRPGQSVYLLANGELLRTANDSNKIFHGGGVIEKLDWNSHVVWSYTISSTTECQHHDICPLPNGNLLVLVWELKTREEALKAGRNPALLKEYLWSEKIIELKPFGNKSAEIVWQWHLWDHLVQDHDSSKINYGAVSKNRQLVDLNFAPGNDMDWLHFNSISYNPYLDQILVSNRNYSEFFILDHSTSSTEAASHRGGKYNKGGDLLYRFGNPRVYKDTVNKQVLFGQHHPYWIEKGLKDEGAILLFNNGMGRARQNNFSSVDLVKPPLDSQGNYSETENSHYEKLYSEMQSDALGGVFFSANVSNAQRLPNGNTLVCSGASGQFCELDPDNTIVWLYVNPVGINGSVKRGEIASLNQVFRCHFFEASYPAFKGRRLKPGLPIESGPPVQNCFQKCISLLSR